MKRIIFSIIEKIRKALKVDEKGNSFWWGKGTLLLTALIMVGCMEHYEETKINSDYSVRVVDSCEYILLNGGGIKAHKGNCRFCEERDSIKWEKRKKELKELVEQLKEK